MNTNTNIHHPSYHFRRTAIAAIVASLLSPSAYAVVTGQDANAAFGTLTGTTAVTPTNAIVAVSSKNITLGVENAASIVNLAGVVAAPPSSSIILDGNTGNIDSIATSGATNVLSVTGGGKLTASNTGVGITGTTNTITGTTNTITGTTNTISTTGGGSLGTNAGGTGITGATNTITGTTANTITGATNTISTTGGGSLGTNAGGTAIAGGANTITGATNTISTTGGGSLSTNVGGTAIAGATNTITGATNTISTTGGGNLSTSANGVAIKGNTVSLLNNVGAGHGLNITSTSTTLSGGTNSSIIAALDGSATISVGTATTPPVLVVNASNTNGNTSIVLGADGVSPTQATSIFSATGVAFNATNPATRNTQGNISSVTGDGGLTQESVSSTTLINGRNELNGLQVYENRTNITGTAINLNGNVAISGNFSAGENFTAGNITARNNLTSNNLSSNNFTLGTGNVTGNLTAGNITSNNDIIALNNVSGINGNFTNLTALGNSTLGNVTAGNGTFASNLTTNNLTANNFTLGNGSVNNITGGNGTFAGNLATNNLTANNFTLGNGSVNNITGGNGTFAGNLTTNNLTANNFTLGDGTVNNITAGNGTFAGNLTTNNLTANNFTLGNGTVTGNFSIGENLTAGNITATNNLTSNNLTSNNFTLGNGTITNLTATTLNVTGQTILSGINNTGPLTNTGDLTNVGNTTLSGTTNINGVLNVSNATVIGLNIDPGSLAADRILGDPAAPLSSNGITGTNTVVGGTGGVITYKAGLTKTVANNTTIGNRLAGVKYQTQVAGNEFIDGNLYVNGDTAFVGTTSATSTVDASKNLASSQLAGKTTGVIGQTGITTTTPVTDLVTNTTKVESVAATTLTNGLGRTNGLQVFEDRTRLTGGGDAAGAPSSSLTLNSNGTTILAGPPGTLASNGVTGITATNPGASVGSGGIEVLSKPATVLPNTTIGDRLNGVTYQDKVNGNTLVDGNLYVNGDTAFVGKTGATSTVVGDPGTSKLGSAGVSGQTGITTSAPVTDIVTGTTTPEAVASTTLTNGLGKTNGLQVFEDRTNLTGGGQQPSSLTLNDSGATFSTSTGAPAKVTGVADGTTRFDAVNFGQLQALSSDVNNLAESAFSGISQASAMAAIPAPMAGHHYSVGMGSGFYAGQQAIAFGGKADVGEHIRLSAAMGSGLGSTSQMAANAGAGFSW